MDAVAFKYDGGEVSHKTVKDQGKLHQRIFEINSVLKNPRMVYLGFENGLHHLALLLIPFSRTAFLLALSMEQVRVLKQVSKNILTIPLFHLQLLDHFFFFLFYFTFTVKTTVSVIAIFKKFKLPFYAFYLPVSVFQLLAKVSFLAECFSFNTTSRLDQITFQIQVLVLWDPPHLTFSVRDRNKYMSLYMFLIHMYMGTQKDRSLWTAHRIFCTENPNYAFLNVC